MQLSRENILQQAPDLASVKAANGLLSISKWQSLGANEQALWGECKGSGKNPYQVQMDISGSAFRCSCPSRKFPCKHGLALALLWIDQNKGFTESELPGWVSEWLQSRQQRAEKQEQKKAAAADKPAEPIDPEAASKRLAKRLQRMTAGMEELERWMQDHIAHGLAQLGHESDIFKPLAARMVDAQLPGLAFRLRQLEGLPGSAPLHGLDWPARLLGALGQIQIMIDAFRRRESLPPAVLSDLYTALGLTPDKDEVLASGEVCEDQWLVLGQSFVEEERLWVRHVWLYAQKQARYALLLDYSHGGKRFEQPYLTGLSYQAKLVFYPGARPLRALVAEPPTLNNTAGPLPRTSSEEAWAHLAQSLSASPWQWPQPFLLNAASLERTENERWALRILDAPEGERTLALQLDDTNGWQLMALSGAHPLVIFGEWHHTALQQALKPLAAWQNGLLIWSLQEQAE